MAALDKCDREILAYSSGSGSDSPAAEALDQSCVGFGASP